MEMDEFAAAINRAIAQAIDQLTGTFTVATTTPDFTVYMDGSAEAVPGRKITGATYSVGTTGEYFRRQGKPPICLPTA